MNPTHQEAAQSASDDGARREAEIAAIAYRLWQDAAQPDGEADRHWVEAQEIWALRQAGHPPTSPSQGGEAEPALALENQAPMPGLDDQSEGNAAPSYDRDSDQLR
jgi:hypothetical protein